MNGCGKVGLDSHPKLAPHRRLYYDTARANWTIQAPERVFLLDEPGHAIVSCCDGEKSVTTIIDQLCETYPDAPREAISTDVVMLVQSFVDKGVMSL